MNIVIIVANPKIINFFPLWLTVWFSNNAPLNIMELILFFLLEYFLAQFRHKNVDYCNNFHSSNYHQKTYNHFDCGICLQIHDV